MIDRCFRFVLKIAVNRYHLVGPYASVLNPSTRGNCNLNKSNCGSRSSRRCRSRRRPATAATMSTCRDPDRAMNRHSTILGMGGHMSHSLQNGNNTWWQSILPGPHRDAFDEHSGLSNVGGNNSAGLGESIGRPGGDFGRGHEAGDQIFDGNEDELNPEVPQHPVGRPGGGYGGRGGGINPPAVNVPGLRGEIGDQSSDEDMEQTRNPIPANEGIQRPGCCGDPEPLPPADHSSDENMFRMEPTVNVSGRRRSQRGRGRCGRRKNSSGPNDNVYPGPCSRRRSRRSNSTCNPEVDSSDYTNDEEDDGEKPWVRNCQVQESRALKRRGRRCSPCAFD